MKRIIKILIFVKSIDGGTGTFIESILKMNKLSSKTSIQIITVCLEKPSFRNIKRDRHIYFRNKGYYPEHYSLSVFNIKNFIREIIWFKKNLEEINPDIILSIDVHCNLITEIEKYLFSFKFKTILTTHIDLKQTLLDKSSPIINFLIKEFVAFFYNKADYLVCVSKKLKNNLKNDFKLKTVAITIYNGKRLKKYEAKKFSPKNTYIICSLARLTKQKDHATLISSFNLLIKNFPDVELWIFSDGPEKNAIKELIRKDHLQSKVKILGWVKNIDTNLIKSDILVLSSKREGFAYCLIEAMEKGIPVISTDTRYGPSEVLQNGKYGILTPVGNPARLKDAILDLLTNPKKYNHYSSMSIKRSTYFSEEKMLRAYSSLFEKALEK